MSYYNPSYTSVKKVRDLVQFTIDDSSVPPQSAVLDWIQQVEARIDERKLATHTVTGEMVDVPTSEEISSKYTWYYEVEHARLKFEFAEGVLVPLAHVRRPIISITKLEKNDEDPDEAPSWETLTEGPAASSHFMLLQSGQKRLGYALWFYDEEPKEGPKRLRLSYDYGYNVDSNILSDYCTMAVAIKVLIARMGTNEPSGLSWLEGGALGTHMNTQYRERISALREEMRRIEEEYFPKEGREEDIALEIL